MDLGSKETELLITLLNEFYDGPNDVKSLVQALRQKSYCKTIPTAYRYANRVLAIKRIFQNRTISKEIGKSVIDKEKGVPFLDMIDLVIGSPGLTQDEKLRYSVNYLDELARCVLRRLNVELRTPEEKPDHSYVGRYNKLREHGLI